MAEPSSLKGKNALVTGGSRGIGRAIALELARRGANIAFTYFRNRSAAEETREAITQLGVGALSLRAHLGDPEGIDSLFAEIDRSWDRLDILVNNAASGVMRSPRRLELKHWDWTMNINARAPWLCAKAAARRMPAGGSIVNVSSPGSMRALPDYFPVGVSKAALEAITRYLAIDLAELGIAVNTVSAGFVRTRALEAFQEQDRIASLASRPTPAGRPVEPEDIAKAVAWLCSPDAQMVRGQIVLVDGGETLLFR